MQGPGVDRGNRGIVTAVHKLKNGKASGPDGLHPQVLKCLDVVNLRVLLEHISRAWHGLAPMVDEGLDNFLAPLPKKRELTHCKRWCGILSASCAGKVFGKILTARLCRHAEANDLMPETQAGFRAGRSGVRTTYGSGALPN